MAFFGARAETAAILFMPSYDKQLLISFFTEEQREYCKIQKIVASYFKGHKAMEGERQQFIQLNPSRARKAKPSEYFQGLITALISGRKTNSEEMMATIVIAFQKCIKCG